MSDKPSDAPIRRLFERARRADATDLPALNELLINDSRPARPVQRWTLAAAGALTVGLTAWAGLLIAIRSNEPVVRQASEPGRLIAFRTEHSAGANEQPSIGEVASLVESSARPAEPTVGHATPEVSSAEAAETTQVALNRPTTPVLAEATGGDAAPKLEAPPQGQVSAAGSDATQARPVDARVQVTANAPIVDLKRTTSTTPFNDEFVQDLPEAGRAYQNALTLAPGVDEVDGDGSSSHFAGSRSRDAPTKLPSPVAPRAAARRKVALDSLSDSSARTRLRQEVTKAKSQPQRSADDGARLPQQRIGRESYAPVTESDFRTVADAPLSTFSIDVDTASYTNVRRMIRQGQRPPADAIRIEEWLNYFDYDYPQPTNGDPFSVDLEMHAAPWQPRHRLLRVGLKAEEIDRSQHEGSNLVFLIDVSGSMDEPAKLPLLQQALGMLVDALDGRDQVSIVVYASASGLVLPPTSGADKATIGGALERLHAGGGTAGAAGIELAYKTAAEHFIEGGVNRVILATDGDFNVGVTSHTGLLDLIQGHANRGIFLTALGFGMGNYQDDRLEHLADKGNGNYAYIDTVEEARKVLVEELGGTLYTVAKDVKIQVEFNPERVAGYRLIGYENRRLNKEDFNDDAKDAGEIGSGHTVTALYEVVPVGVQLARATVDPLKYQSAPQPSPRSAVSNEWLTVKLRYKPPTSDSSKLIEVPFTDDAGASISADFEFAACVAAAGMVLRGSEHVGSATMAQVLELARQARGADRFGYRSQFVELMDQAQTLLGETDLDRRQGDGAVRD